MLTCPVSAKNCDLRPAQPPRQRLFDRPTRWYLGSLRLRARGVQNATFRLPYVTCGGSNLPTHPKMHRRVPTRGEQNACLNVPKALLLVLGALTRTSECIPIGSDPECTKIPSHKAPPPEKQHFFLPKNNKKGKSPAGIEPTTSKAPRQPHATTPGDDTAVLPLR